MAKQHGSSTSPEGAVHRIVEPEALDDLREDDPLAQGSRRDLVRLHHFMGTASILRTGLREWGTRSDPAGPLRILEIGAGDGTLMLRVARSLCAGWPAVDVTLLDRQTLVSPATVAGYGALGWTVASAKVDIEDWAHQRCEGDDRCAPASAARWDIVVANLFLHHFSGARLCRILQAVAASTDRFFACEPRRSYLALGASHLVGAIGANAITRQDAVLSVRAGFRGEELTAAWSEIPGMPGPQSPWQISEYAAGAFSHCFRAQRRQTP